MFQEDFIFGLEIEDISLSDLMLSLFREMALDVLRDIKKSLLQLTKLPRQSLEYRLLIFDMQRKVVEVKSLIDSIIGEEIPTGQEDDDEFDIEVEVDVSGEDSIESLLEMIEITEEKLQADNLIEAIALFLAFYERINSSFCETCISDAS